MLKSASCSVSAMKFQRLLASEVKIFFQEPGIADSFANEYPGVWNSHKPLILALGLAGLGLMGNTIFYFKCSQFSVVGIEGVICRRETG